MCGIAGLWTRGGGPVDEGTLVVLRDAMRRRGPDDAGLLVRGDLGLAHRRLSIVDLSAAGRQPLANETGEVLTVFNGEIYNHGVLRAQLEARGHRFTSRTDGEVLVHGWEEWGADLLPRLNGMFAFALWDDRRRRLVLARDRLGVKPLYLLDSGRRLAFASEAKALALAFPDAVSIDWNAIDAYLHFGFVPQETGVYREIRALPPGHWLEVGEHEQRLTRYWELRFAPAATPPGGWRRAVRATLAAAVKRRLVADVPVGVLLSGGVDSSVVAALARRTGAEPEAFTVAFDGAAAADGSDLHAARTVAAHLGLRQHECIVGATEVQALDELVWAFGVPFADASAVPLHHLGRMAAAADTKVLLTGDGGDEVFGGYSNVQAAYLGWMCRRTAAVVPGGLGALRAAAALDGRLPRRPRLLHRLVTVLAYAARDLDAGLRWTNGWHGAALGALRGPALRDAAANGDDLLVRHARAAAADNDIERRLLAWLAVILPGDFLVKADVALMAASVEGRSPFLDVETVELGARIPLGSKLSPLRPKHLLKRVALDLGLPRAPILRRKRGFDAPVAAWLRGPLRARARDCLLGTLPARGVIDGAVVRRAWEAHAAGADEDAHRLWILFCLELWFRAFVDREAPRLAVGSSA
jgi:asparagine synthase (glutamine-hydrolysing)